MTPYRETRRRRMTRKVRPNRGTHLRPLTFAALLVAGSALTLLATAVTALWFVPSYGSAIALIGLLAWMCWTIGLARTSVKLTDQLLTVQNPIRRHEIPLHAITAFDRKHQYVIFGQMDSLTATYSTQQERPRNVTILAVSEFERTGYIDAWLEHGHTLGLPGITRFRRQAPGRH